MFEQLVPPDWKLWKIPAMRTKILLDTAIGSDIDDAVYLAYLLANPQCESMGITTVFHDPLAATTIFAEQICTFQKGTVEVELIGEKSKGMLFWQAGGAETKHEIALEVNSTQFFEHFFQCFKQE